jgi:hypothetical protein
MGSQVTSGLYEDKGLTENSTNSNSNSGGDITSSLNVPGSRDLGDSSATTTGENTGNAKVQGPSSKEGSPLLRGDSSGDEDVRNVDDPIPGPAPRLKHADVYRVSPKYQYAIYAVCYIINYNQKY